MIERRCYRRTEKSDLGACGDKLSDDSVAPATNLKSEDTTEFLRYELDVVYPSRPCNVSECVIAIRDGVY